MADSDAQQFVIRNGVLCKVADSTVHDAAAQRVNIVVPASLQDQVARAVHGLQGAEHRGIMSSVHIAKARFFWSSLVADVWRVTKNCPTCQRAGTAPPRAPFTEHLRSDIPGQKWVVDLLFLEDDGPFSIVLTMRDVCSRWVIATPVVNKTSKEIARVMVEQWSKAGVHFQPEQVIHDNGSEFKRVFQAACELINVEQRWSIAGRPESHGLIERFHRDLCQMIGKRKRAQRHVLKPHMKQWTWALPYATAAINSAPARPLSGATVKGFCSAFAPSEIFHGLEPRAALDTALQKKPAVVKGSDKEIEESLASIRMAQ